MGIWVYFDRDHLLWRCLSLVSVSVYTGSYFVSLLCSGGRTSWSELLSSQFWSDCGERLAKKRLLEDPWFLRIAGVKDGLNEWNLVLKLHQSVYGTAASLPLPLPPFKSIPSSMLVPEAVAGCLVHACLQSPFSLSYRPGFCYLHCAPCPSPAVLVPRGT